MHALLFAVALSLQDPLQEDIDRAVANLYSDRLSESDLARAELIEIGRRAVPKLVAELRKQRSAERTTQVRARRALCEILGRIRDNSPDVVNALVERLKDGDEYGVTVAAAAAGALGAIADDRAMKALVEALGSKQADADKWLKYYCIHALGVLRATPAAEALKKALEDPGAAQLGDADAYLIAAAAADALGRLRVKDAVDGLGKLLADERRDPFSDQIVAVHAARALERILGESKGPLEGDQQAVRQALEGWRTWWKGEETKKNAVTTRQRLAEIAQALEAFKRDHGKYPMVLDHLKTKPADHTGRWPDGGYHKGELKDAWGRAIKYDPSGDDGAPFDLVSDGADGQPWGRGDNADLWNHDAWKKVRADKTLAALNEVKKALDTFRGEQGKLPDRLDHLVGDKPPAGFTPQKEWPKDGYLKEVPKDGFGNRLEYKQPGTGGEPFDLWSLGADRAVGGVDENSDLWSHDKWKAPKVEETKRKLDALVKAIEQFKKDQERHPARLEDLRDKPGYAKRWPPDGYVRDVVDPTNDAFGNALVYRATGTAGRAFDVVSLGADGREGGSGPDEDLTWPPK